MLTGPEVQPFGGELVPARLCLAVGAQEGAGRLRRLPSFLCLPPKPSSPKRALLPNAGRD